MSADQFGEQTAIKIGKGSLKGMTLSAELVSEWIASFPIMAHVSDRMDHIYAQLFLHRSSTKEDFKHRRILDAYDQHAEAEKYPDPLEDDCPNLYNPKTGQIAQANVNVADSIFIGEKMEREYIASLPDGFYNPISSPITTMSVSKKQVKDKQFRLVIDLESIFLRLLMISQQRQMEIEPLLAVELCAVPPSLIDEHRVLWYLRPYHVLLKLSSWMFHSCFTILFKSFKSLSK